MGKNEFVARPLLELNIVKSEKSARILSFEYRDHYIAEVSHIGLRNCKFSRMAGRRGEGRGRLLSIWHFKSVAVGVGPNGESYGKQDCAEGCVQKVIKTKS